MSLGGRYYCSEELRKMGFAHVGENVKIHERASVYCVENISIGDNVRIDDFSVIVATGKLEIGSYVHIANFCFLGSKYGVRIGDFCGIAAGVHIYTASDDYSGKYLTGPMVPSDLTSGSKGKVTLGNHVIIGSNSIILPNVVIGEGSSVGALSLVTKDLKSWGVYIGSPVRYVSERSKKILELAKKVVD